MAAPVITFGGVDAFGARRSPDEVRIIREMLDEDISKFVADSGIDGPAARELKSESPEIQWAVLQRGPVRSATNPSAALVGRIRDAKQNIGRLTSAQLLPGQHPQQAAPAVADPNKPLTEVDRFIQDNRLDQTAGANLRSESAEVQRLVMQQGPLLSCYNPSGALMGRIRAARTGQLAYKPSTGGAGGASGSGKASAPTPAPLALAAPGVAAAGGSGGGDGPLLALPAPPSQPQPQPALPSLGGGDGGGGASATAAAASGGIDAGRLSLDAMKAIQQLTAANGAGRDAGAAAPTPAGGGGGGVGGAVPAVSSGQVAHLAASEAAHAAAAANQKYANVEDTRLNIEAMKAIQMLNAGGP